MADVDVSSYKIAPVNPFEQFGKAVGIANALEQNKLLQTHNQATDLQLQQNRQGAVMDMLTSLASRPDLNWGHIEDAAKRAIFEYHMPAPFVASVVNDLRRDEQNPDGLRKRLNVMITQQVSRDARPGAIYGPVTPISGPGGTTLIRPPTVPNYPVTDAGSVSSTLPPGTATVNPVTREKEYITQGTPGVFTPPMPPENPNKLPITPTVVPTTRVPPRPKREIAELAPGEAEAARVAGQSSGETLAAVRRSNVNYRAEVTPLEQAIPILEKLGTTGTGPGTEGFQQFRSFLQSAGVPLPKGQATATQLYDEARKYLNQNANQVGGGRTNEQLFAAVASNPSTGISNAAAVDLSKTMVAQRRLKYMLEQEYNRAREANPKLTEAGFETWASRRNPTMDARLASFDLMPKERRVEALKGMSEAQRDVFLSKVKQLRDDGVLTLFNR